MSDREAAATAADAGWVVFLPGFKGSRLVDAQTREVLWLTAWGALPFTPVPPLALPDTRAVAADGALESLLGGLYAVYAPFLRFARGRWGARLSVFAYDWRQGNAATARRLEAHLAQLLRSAAQDTPAAPLTLIVHSMGGLVVWALLSRLAAEAADRDDEESGDTNDEERRRLVACVARARIVFVGTPFEPVEALLEDMTPGTRAHCAYLPAAVLATHPAAYELLAPPRAACDARLHDAAFWAARRVGVFGTAPPQPPECRAAVQDMLARADAFRTRTLRADFAHTPFARLRVAAVASRARPTKAGLPAAFFDTSAALDWDTCPRAPGDGRVPFRSATAVPAGLDLCAVALTPNDHGTLLNDSAALLEALAALDAPPQPSQPSPPQPSPQ